MTDVRLSELTFGTLCWVGITLSNCFWLPVSILLGLGEAWVLSSDTHWRLLGLVRGLLRGLCCSMLTDVIIVLGAVIFSASRRIGISLDFALRRR